MEETGCMATGDDWEEIRARTMTLCKKTCQRKRMEESFQLICSMFTSISQL